MTYLVRTVDHELDGLILGAPAIALDGPKGVGKTDTASRRAAQTWQLDDPDQRERLRSDFALGSVAPHGTVLFDEWQRLPQVWDSVRRQVDRGAPPGRFLLTGSATPTDSLGTHSGAGRIMSLRMRPMGLHERGLTQPSVSLSGLLAGTSDVVSGDTTFTLTNYVDAIVSSGFPATVSLTAPQRHAFLRAYVARIIDRDLSELGIAVRKPDTLLRWLRAYAAATATTTAYSRLLDAATAGDGAQPAKTTTTAYRDQLAQLWLLDTLPGWLPSHSAFTQLRQAPKHHLADPALAAQLLGQSASTLLSPRGASLTGQLFESLVTLGVRVAAQAADATVSHLRTKAGEREIDLIVEGFDGRILAIEVKLASSVNDADVRHLVWLRDQLPDAVVDTVVVTTGSAAYRRSDGVAVVPLALLGP